MGIVKSCDSRTRVCCLLDCSGCCMYPAAEAVAQNSEVVMLHRATVVATGKVLFTIALDYGWWFLVGLFAFRYTPLTSELIILGSDYFLCLETQDKSSYRGITMYLLKSGRGIWFIQSPIISNPNVCSNQFSGYANPLKVSWCVARFSDVGVMNVRNPKMKEKNKLMSTL